MASDDDRVAAAARARAMTERPPTKREIKRAYLRADIGLSDAVPALMFDHGMDRGEAFRYLMESAREKAT